MIPYIYIFECLDCNKYIGVLLQIDEDEEEMRLYKKLVELRDKINMECVFCDNIERLTEIYMPVRHLKEGLNLIDEHNQVINIIKET